jgi:hypothetical protein
VRPQKFTLWTSAMTWADSGLIYAHDGEDSGQDLYSLQVSPSGLTKTADIPQFVGNTGIRFVGGLLYDYRGIVYNPPAHTVVGSYPTGASVPIYQDEFFPQPSRNRAFGAGSDSGSQLTLYVYDFGNFSLLDTLAPTGFYYTPRALTPLGPGSVAIVTYDNRILVVSGGQL